MSLLAHLFLVVDEEVLEHVLGDLRAAHVDAVARILDLSHALLQHLHLPFQLTAVRAGERKKATVYLVLQEFQRFPYSESLRNLLHAVWSKRE